MKLEDYDKLRPLVEQYKHFQDLITATESGVVNVTINNKYQDKYFVEKVKPAMLEELNARLDEVKLPLIDLGVTYE